MQRDHSRHAYHALHARRGKDVILIQRQQFLAAHPDNSASHSFAGLAPNPVQFPPSLLWLECCLCFHEPLRFSHREAAMDEAIDRTHASSSPEELAIHFLLRHAECRSALTGKTGEDRPDGAAAPSRPDESATHEAAINSQRSEGSLPSSHEAAAGVTRSDSCTASFLRAYAAARHIRVDVIKPDGVRPTTMAAPDAASDLKQECQENVRE